MRRLLGVYASATIPYMHKMIEGIKTYKPEVKASKSDRWLRNYGHSKVFHVFIVIFSCLFEQCSRLLNAALTPTRENIDIPARGK